MKLSDSDILKLGKEVLKIESTAIAELITHLDEKFIQACRKILACRGRVIVTGMGKSGHIARKISATFASTGTPAFFLHPAEASHGDLGMVVPEDIMLAFSYTGETEELRFILPLIKRLNVFLITITGDPNSHMAKLADLQLTAHISKEACSLGLAPTASTTAALALGDALAIATLSARGFTVEDFARTHPGGSLGRKLCTTIDELMHTEARIPRVAEDATISQALLEMTQKRLGMTTIYAKAKDKPLIGVFTDGDVRRTLEKNIDIHKTLISSVMTKNFKTISSGTLATEALNLMEKHKITALPVIDKKNQLIGALNIQDILKTGVL